jgi:uncharacterized NAD(P)/FAD-binding protein YdhS
VVKARTSDELPVAIVGGGFSGTLLAINLLRHGVKTVLIERDEAQLAKGLAFGTRRAEHLLNVRAANMSAFPDDLGHFLRWMGFSAADQANRFVPRLAYGRYLRELLVDAFAAAPANARVLAGEAVAADVGADGIRLSLKGGRAVECRALVLALGNFPPRPLPPLAGLPAGLHFADAWQNGALEKLDDVEHVVLLGSGLTAVDTILSLDGAGYRGRITALSRRGLQPRGHAESGPAAKGVAEPEASGSWLVRAVRERAAAVGWRMAIDELRPHTQHVWRRHDTTAQRRFLRHLRPYWDVHRHRLAPSVADRIAALQQTGRLTFLAGKLESAAVEGDSARLDWRPRGETRKRSLLAQRVISCTGPDGDIARAGHQLLDSLLVQGAIRPDAHRLGLDVEQSGRLRDARGAPQDALFAVGPLTKGEAWEIVAVPDIRRQVWDLARYLGSAHWVGGEGL